MRAQVRGGALQHLALLLHLKAAGEAADVHTAAAAAFRSKCARLRKAFPECAAAVVGEGKEGAALAAAAVAGDAQAAEGALQEDEDEFDEDDEAEGAEAVRRTSHLFSNLCSTVATFASRRVCFFF